MMLNSKSTIKFFSLLSMIFIITTLLIEKIQLIDIPVHSTFILLILLILLMIIIIKNS